MRRDRFDVRKVPQRYLGIGIVGLYIVLATLYTLATPLFEAPDEYYHFAVIAHLAQTGQFPPKTVPPPNPDLSYELSHPWHQMTFHAPLYYMMASGLVHGRAIHAFAAYRLNPHAQIGVGLARENVNFIAHVPGLKADRTVYAVRFFSIGLGVVTVASVFLLGRAVLGDFWWSGVLPAVIVMATPQFLFISGVVNNDNLITALASIVLVLLVHMIRKPYSRRIVYGLAVLLACATLAKASGLTLYPITALVLLYGKVRWRMQWRKIIEYGVVMIGAWVMIAGWWYFNNYLSFGEFTGAGMVARATGFRSVPVTVSELLGLYYSYWGLFGWFNVQPPDVYYALTFGLLLAAAIGWGCYALSRPVLRNDTVVITLTLLLYCMIFIAAWWQFNMRVLAAQGRLWFPMIGVFAVTLAWGIAHLPGLLRWIGVLMLGVMLIAAALMPLSIISPAYGPDYGVQVEKWTPPADAVPFDVSEPWRDVTCLRLWAAPIQIIDETLQADVYLESTCRMDGYWSMYTHLVDLDLLRCVAGDTRSILAQHDTMPQGGKLTFPALKPGYVVRETLTIPLPNGLREDGSYALHLGLYDAGGGSFIRAPLHGENAEHVRVGTCSSDYILFPL